MENKKHPIQDKQQFYRLMSLNSMSLGNDSG